MKNKNRKTIFVIAAGILIIVLLFIGASKAHGAEPEPLPEPVCIPPAPLCIQGETTFLPMVSKNERGWMIGSVVNEYDGLPVVGAVVRLADVYCFNEDCTKGVMILDNAFSPGAVIQSDGRFAVYAPPHKYAVVISETGDLSYGRYDIIEREDKPWIVKVFEVQAESILDVGVLETWLRYGEYAEKTSADGVITIEF